MKKYLQEGVLVIGILIVLSACTSLNEKEEAPIVESNSDVVETVDQNSTEAAYHESVQDQTNQDTNLLQPVKWSINTLIDTDMPELDYADEQKIIFHTYFGLFVYDLNHSGITQSVDLKKINSQKVQRGGKTEFVVSEDGEKVWICPYKSEDMYYFDINENTVIKMKYMMPNDSFQNVLSKWDIEKDALESSVQLCSDNVIVLSDGTYGYISMDNAEITTMKFHGFGSSWQLFEEDNAPQEPVISQDESFYSAYRMYADRSLSNFLHVYTIFYDMGDYAGICTLSKGLEYTDEQQSEWGEKDERISIEMNAEDEEKNAVRCPCDIINENGEKKELFLDLEKEGESWFAIGLPQ